MFENGDKNIVSFFKFVVFVKFEAADWRGKVGAGWRGWKGGKVWPRPPAGKPS